MRQQSAEQRRREESLRATKRAIIEAQLERGGCVYCPCGKSFGRVEDAMAGLQAHHVIQRSLGGSDEVDNLSLLCCACHEKQHSAEGLSAVRQAGRFVADRLPKRDAEVAEAAEDQNTEPDPFNQRDPEVERALAPWFATVGPVEALRQVGVEVTEVGLCFHRQLTFEEWQDAGSLLLFVDEKAKVATRFALGDWYNHGTRWGERADSVASCLPEHSYRTVRHYGYVSERYQFGTRVPNWQWIMFRDLAPEEEPVRRRVLALPVQEAREEIARLKEARTEKMVREKPSWTPLSGDDLKGRVREVLEEFGAADVSESVVDKALKVLAGQTNNIHVSDETYEWFTPPQYVEAARRVMGGIDMDPATHPLAQEYIRAERYETRDTDGLKAVWEGRVWLNPPYDSPAVGQFIEKAVEEYEAGRVKQAVVLTNNCTDTAWFHRIASAARAMCFTKGRVQFTNPNTEVLAARQGQVFFYLSDGYGEFDEVFGRFGLVVHL